MEPEATEQMPLPSVLGSPGVLRLPLCRRQPELPPEGRAARHGCLLEKKGVLWDLGNSTARASEKVSPGAKSREHSAKRGSSGRIQALSCSGDRIVFH